MGWRDFKLPTPIDKRYKIYKTSLSESFVSIVDIVHRVSPTEKVGAFPYQQGIPEAQEYALTEIMGEMVQTICDRIVEEHKRIGKASYVSTSETQWSEDEITRIYHNVLRGEAKLSDYEKACNKWLAVVIANLNK